MKIHKGNVKSLENELSTMNNDTKGDFDLSDIESD